MPNVRASDKTQQVFWIKRANKAKLKQAAALKGMSVTEYLHKLIDDDIESTKRSKGRAK